MRHRATLLAAALLVGACGAPALTHLPGLRVSAWDGLREARLQAVSWDAGAVLRFIEGEGIAADGNVLADTEGHWRYVYDAPGKQDQLVVTIHPTSEERRTRPPQSPPGFVVGSATLGEGWIDSPRALEALRASLPADSALSMLLVPTTPPQWIVRTPGGRQWRVNATTGAVIR